MFYTKFNLSLELLYLLKIFRQMKSSYYLLLTIVLCFNLSSINAQKKIKLDYKDIAREIIQEATTNEEKAKAIYQHICQTISYDVDYKINTPEECYTEKKGTCQGYAQLFAELCKAVKVKCTYISGVTKDESYNKQLATSNATHAYLLVEGDNKEMFFVDPTWGAGRVVKGEFIRSKNDMSWFKVEPEWMIFSHFPAEPKHQQLDKPLTQEEFLSMPDLSPYLKYFGFNGKELLDAFRSKTIASMPQVIYHPDNIDMLTVVDVPLTESLNVGDTYKFTIKKKNDVKYFLRHNENSFTNWDDDGTDLSISYTPDAPGRIYLAYQSTGQHESHIYELLNYQVPTPSPEKYKELIAIDPYYSPEIQALPGYMRRIKELGFDGKKILEGIQNKQVTSLPKTYAHKFNEFKVIDLPCNGHLKVGKECRFMVDVPQHLEMALIWNNEFFTDWNTIGDSMRELMFTPDDAGTITINARRRGEDKYQAILEYIIDEPTEREWEILAREDPYYNRILRECKGYSPDLKKLKFDGHKLVEGIKQGTFTELPGAVYHNEYPVRVIDVPLDKILITDSTYIFNIVIPGKGKPILRLNGATLPEQWQEMEGIWEIKFTPIDKGELNVAILDEGTSQCYNTITYTISEPFRTKKMIVDDCLAFIARQRNVVIATIGEDGLPKLHSLPVLKYTNEALYFAVSPGREIFWQLQKKPYVELMGVDSNESMHIGGNVSFDVPDHVAKEIYNENETLRMILDDYTKLKYFSVKIELARHNRIALTK